MYSWCVKDKHQHWECTWNVLTHFTGLIFYVLYRSLSLFSHHYHHLITFVIRVGSTYGDHFAQKKSHLKWPFLCEAKSPTYQRKLIAAVVIPFIPNWSFRFCRANWRYKSLAVLNFLCVKPLCSFSLLSVSLSLWIAATYSWSCWFVRLFCPLLLM